MIPSYHKIIVMAAFALLFSTSAQADTVNTNNHKEHDFDNNSIVPFSEDQGFTGSQIYNEGMSFQNSTIDGKRLKITWKESEYDGTRRERGHELKLNVVDDNEIYCGFYWFTPSPAGVSTNNMRSKKTIIWQLYCWNSAGCSNWTAHIEMRPDDDLWLSYREACVTPTEVKFMNNPALNTDHAFQIRTVASDTNHGNITILRNGSTLASQTNINLGFGNFSGGVMTDAVIGVKMGLYAYDTGNYTNNEQRVVYLENVGVSKRSGTVANSLAKIDPRDYN